MMNYSMMKIKKFIKLIFKKTFRKNTIIKINNFISNNNYNINNNNNNNNNNYNIFL